MRLGYPSGTDADTRGLWRFVQTTSSAAADLADASGNGNAAVLVGSPTFGAGYYGEGITCAVGSYATATNVAGLDGTSSHTIDLWLRVTSITTGNDQSVIHRESGTANRICVQLFVNDAAGTLGVNVRDAADALTAAPATRRGIQPLRWYHVKVVIDFVLGRSSIIVDGQLWARAAHTAAASIRAGTVWHVGHGNSIVSELHFAGTISEPRIRTVVDASLTTCAPRLQTLELSRHVNELATHWLREDVSDDTWTADAGDWYRALSGIDLGALVVNREDVRSVKATLTAGGTIVTYTEVYAKADVIAATWWLDETNRRLYVGTDPATLDSLGIEAAFRVATYGYRGAGGWFVSALEKIGDVTTVSARLFKPMDMSGGCSLSLASQHASVPSRDTTATGISWEGSDVEVASLAEGAPWSERRVLVTGWVEGKPTDDADRVTVQVRPRLARMHLGSLARVTATQQDYSDIHSDHSGRPFAVIYGQGHIDVPCVCLTKTAVAGRYTWQIGPPPNAEGVLFRIGRINKIHTSGSGAAIPIYSVNLEQGGQFTCALGPNTSLVADCDGWADTVVAATAAGPVVAFGSPADAETQADKILQAILQYFGGFVAADFDSTWAATAVRVAVPLRYALKSAEPGALADLLAQVRDDCYAFLVPRTSGSIGWRDVVKAEAAIDTIRSSDLRGSVKWELDREKLAPRLEMTLSGQAVRLDGSVFPLETISIALRARERSDRREPQRIGVAGFMTPGAGSDYLTRVRAFFEQPTRVGVARCVGRLDAVDLWDPVTLEADLPAGAGSRFRVLGKVGGPNTADLVLVSEDNFQASAVSAPVVEPPLDRPRFRPTTLFRWGQRTPLVLGSTGGDWRLVADDAGCPVDGEGTPAWPATSTPKFAGDAQRVGGAADTDFQLRLIRRSDSAVVVTLSGGFPAARALREVSGIANWPSTMDGFLLQYRCLAGVSARIWTASYEADEDASVTSLDKRPPHLDWSVYSDVGFLVTAATATGFLGAFSGFRKQAEVRGGAAGTVEACIADVDPGGAGRTVFVEANGWTTPGAVWNFLGASEAGRRYVRGWAGVVWGGGADVQIGGSVIGAGSRIHGVAKWRHHGATARDAASSARVVWATGPRSSGMEVLLPVTGGAWLDLETDGYLRQGDIPYLAGGFTIDAWGRFSAVVRAGAGAGAPIMFSVDTLGGPQFRFYDETSSTVIAQMWFGSTGGAVRPWRKSVAVVPTMPADLATVKLQYRYHPVISETGGGGVPGARVDILTPAAWTAIQLRRA